MQTTHSNKKQKAQVHLRLLQSLLKIVVLFCETVNYFIQQLIFSHHDPTKSIREYQQRQIETLKQQQELTEEIRILIDKLRDNPK